MDHDYKELEIWKNLTSLWIENAKMFEFHKDPKLKADIDLLTDHDSALVISRQLLVLYADRYHKFKKKVEGGEHYDHFFMLAAERFDKSEEEEDRRHLLGNDEDWWMVYQTLYQLWLVNNRSLLENKVEWLGNENTRPSFPPPPPMPPPFRRTHGSN